MLEAQLLCLLPLTLPGDSRRSQAACWEWVGAGGKESTGHGGPDPPLCSGDRSTQTHSVLALQSASDAVPQVFLPRAPHSCCMQSQPLSHTNTSERGGQTSEG